MPTPLRQTPLSITGFGPESPEALLISALLEEGVFDGSRYQITEEDLDCYQQLWSWCSDHQDRVGRAPSVELVRRHFPEFTVTPDVDVNWAANRLRQASLGRRMRANINEQLALLADGDVEGAYELMERIDPPFSIRREGVRLFDLDPPDGELVGVSIDVPYPTLGAVTGGIGPGKMWVLGGRTGVGKTSIAAGAYVAKAIKQGFSTAYFSCEMPALEIVDIVRVGLAAGNTVASADLVRMLSSKLLEQREHGIELLRAQVNRQGSLSVYDPSHGRITPEAIAEAMNTHDLVVVDHIELIVTADGRRAVEDWRVLAEISIRLKESVLRQHGRLLVLSQANRQAESNNTARTPKLTELSGSDQVGRDADVSVTMSRYSTGSLLHDAVKVRRGPGVRFFTTFDPAAGQYMEITPNVAAVIKERDENYRKSQVEVYN
jgi:DnaB-like helicase C terminal domain